jgi:hypothetical protein
MQGLLLAVALILILGLAGFFWQGQRPVISGGRPTAQTAEMENQLAGLAHPPHTQQVHRLAEEGPSAAGENCPPWLLAGESRTFRGSREPILSFYPEPYQVVFVDEMKPIEGNEPMIILGYPLSGWGLTESQLDKAYIVYHLASTACESSEAEHHH